MLCNINSGVNIKLYDQMHKGAICKNQNSFSLMTSVPIKQTAVSILLLVSMLLIHQHRQAVALTLAS